MAFNTPDFRAAAPTSLGDPTGTLNRTGAISERRPLCRTRKSATYRVRFRSENGDQASHLLRSCALIASLTMAALIIGSLTGGWPHAAILAVIALAESLAVFRSADRSRPVVADEPPENNGAAAPTWIRRRS